MFVNCFKGKCRDKFLKHLPDIPKPTVYITCVCIMICYDTSDCCEYKVYTINLSGRQQSKSQTISYGIKCMRCLKIRGHWPPFESTKTYADRQRLEVSYDCMLALLFMLCCCVPAISCFSNLVFKRVE